MHPQWFLVGAGRCGLQLVRAMLEASIEVVGAEVRSARGRARVRRAVPGLRAFGPARPLPQVGAILVAVPEFAITECAAALAGRVRRPGPVVVHTSGLAPADALAPLRRAGCRLGSMHPLVSFPSAAGPAVPLDGVAAAIEGDAEAVRCAARLARALGMRPFRLAAASKPRYHAAAALAANATHVLAATARELLVQSGLPRRASAGALRRLVHGSVEAALSAHGLERLTGPVARADAAALHADLAALPPPARAAYRAAAGLAIRAMKTQGLVNAQQARRLVAALTRPT